MTMWTSDTWIHEYTNLIVQLVATDKQNLLEVIGIMIVKVMVMLTVLAMTLLVDERKMMIGITWRNCFGTLEGRC